MTLLQMVDGTLINAVAVLIGSAAGLALRSRLPDRTVTVVMQAVGLTTVFIGLHAAWDLTRIADPPGVIVALLALAFGGMAGEALQLERTLDRIGDRLKRRFGGEGRFTEGFVAATLLFCVGPLTLIGAIQNGLTGDASFLLLKSALDGFSALALAATFGPGVAASVLVILTYQGGLSLGAGQVARWLPDPATDPRALLVNGVGGLMILGLGITLLQIQRIRVASLLPALVLAVPIWWALSFAF